MTMPQRVLGRVDAQRGELNYCVGQVADTHASIDAPASTGPYLGASPNSARQ
jgi:hypothetical protein